LVVFYFARACLLLLEGWPWCLETRDPKQPMALYTCKLVVLAQVQGSKRSRGGKEGEHERERERERGAQEKPTRREE